MTANVRLIAAVAVAVAAALVGVLLLTGSSEGGDGDLAWDHVQLVDSGRPTDSILYGRLKSTALKDVRLDVDDVRVLGADGRPVKSAVVFLPAFAHGLFPASQRPDRVGDPERRRLGQIVTLKPGQSVPITLSWRVPKGGEQPEKVDFGPAELALP